MTTSSSSSSTNAIPSSSGNPAPDDLLDLRGEVCPYTFVLARLRLEEMDLGQALEILVDHQPAIRNVPRSARAWGQDVQDVAPAPAHGPDVWRIVVRKRVL